MRRLWLLFAQATTIALGVYFVLATLRPDLVERRPAGAPPAAAVAVAPATVAPAPAGAAPLAAPLAVGFADAASRAMPAVVNIFTSKVVRPERHPLLDDPFFKFFFGERGGMQRAPSLGSGVIVSADGYVVTNSHVVEAADTIEVALADGRRVAAKVVGSDPETDLAVIRIGLGELPAIALGDSDAVRVGDLVLAIGNPFGVGQTVTMGIVSALGRDQLGLHTFENYIQTDAAINPGNSGGALTDAAGNLIGINTAIFTRSGGWQGIGFAIPATTVRQVMQQLIAHGAVIRGWLGVETQDLTRELAESFGLRATTAGAVIARLAHGGPAHGAGLRPGDVVIAINGQPIGGTAALLRSVAALSPGSTATLRVLRERKEIEVPVTIGRRPVVRRR
jgi:serine protease DegQ